MEFIRGMHDALAVLTGYQAGQMFVATCAGAIVFIVMLKVAGKLVRYL